MLWCMLLVLLIIWKFSCWSLQHIYINGNFLTFAHSLANSKTRINGTTDRIHLLISSVIPFLTFFSLLVSLILSTLIISYICSLCFIYFVLFFFSLILLIFFFFFCLLQQNTNLVRRVREVCFNDIF